MKHGILWICAGVLVIACSLDEQGTALFPPGDAGSKYDSDFPDGSPWPDAENDVKAEAEGSTPDADGSVDAPADQTADVEEDASSDAPEDVTQDVVPDVQKDAPADAVADAPADTGTTNCLAQGIRVRWKPPVASINSPIVQANGAVSNPNNFGTMCTASQDMDPDPKAFDCCFSTTPAPKNTLVFFDFVLQDTSHACGLSGCPAPFSQYAVWADGKLLADYAVTFLPGCQIAGSCPYVLQATIPP